MIERLKLRIVISEIVIESVVPPNLPSAVEMETLNELSTVMKRFEYVTRSILPKIYNHFQNYTNA